MAALTFTKTTILGKDAWVATLQVEADSAVNVDIERAGDGILVMAQKHPSAKNYKTSHVFDKGLEYRADLNFNILNDATSQALDVKLTSYSEVTNAYYG